MTNTRLKQALTAFEARFKRGEIPDDLQIKEIQTPEDGYPIANLLKDAGLTQSTSESLRMLQQGAVKIDSEKVSDTKHRLQAGTEHVYQVGKRRIAKIRLV